VAKRGWSVQAAQRVPDGRPELLRIAARTHYHPGLARRRLQEGEKHGRLCFLSKAAVFSLFHNAHDLDARSIGQLVIFAHYAAVRTEDGAREFLVDHRYPRRILIVMPGEASSGEQGSTGRVEIFRRYLVHEGLRSGISLAQLRGFIGKDQARGRARV
jgi:hypothetical protein